MSLVLDASMALSWFFIDERSSAGRDVFDSVVSKGATVPSIWHLEMANALQSAVRRKRIDLPFRDATLADLKMLFISVDHDTHRQAWTEVLRLADRFGLTVYDATYLELACRLSLPLATLDSALAEAAAASRLRVLGK